MDISLFVRLYLISIPLFFAFDMFWLGVVAKTWYNNALKNFLGPVNWPAAFLFYGLFLIGVTYFVTYPGVTSKQTLGMVALTGALFGFFTYATYDLTNYATLKDWPLSITLLDMAWGTTLGALVATLTVLLVRYV